MGRLSRMKGEKPKCTSFSDFGASTRAPSSGLHATEWVFTPTITIRVSLSKYRQPLQRNPNFPL